jgi:hypothetical protein
MAIFARTPSSPHNTRRFGGCQSGHDAFPVPSQDRDSGELVAIQPHSKGKARARTSVVRCDCSGTLPPVTEHHKRRHGFHPYSGSAIRIHSRGAHTWPKRRKSRVLASSEVARASGPWCSGVFASNGCFILPIPSWLHSHEAGVANCFYSCLLLACTSSCPSFVIT